MHYNKYNSNYFISKLQENYDTFNRNIAETGEIKTKHLFNGISVVFGKIKCTKELNVVERLFSELFSIFITKEQKLIQFGHALVELQNTSDGVKHSETLQKIAFIYQKIMSKPKYENLKVDSILYQLNLPLSELATFSVSKETAQHHLSSYETGAFLCCREDSGDLIFYVKQDHEIEKIIARAVPGQDNFYSIEQTQFNSLSDLIISNKKFKQPVFLDNENEVNTKKTEQYTQVTETRLQLRRDLIVSYIEKAWKFDSHSKSYFESMKNEMAQFSVDINESITALYHLGLDILNPKLLIEEIHEFVKQKMIDKEKAKELEEIILINALKIIIGHEWSLDIYFKLSNRLFSAAACSLEATHANLAKQAEEFFQASHSSLDDRSKEACIAAQTAAIFFYVPENESQNIIKQQAKGALEQLQNYNLLTIATGWEAHATEIHFHKGENGKYYLGYCNRGQTDRDRSQMNAALYGEGKLKDMVRFEITKPEAISPELIERLIRNQVEVRPKGQAFLENGELHKILGLKYVGYVKKMPQKMGNCSWVNAKGGLHFSLISKHFDAIIHEFAGVSITEEDEKTAWELAVKRGTEDYKEFEIFNRANSLESFLALSNVADPTILNTRTHFLLFSLLMHKFLNKKEMYSSKRDLFSNSRIAQDIQRIQKLANDFIENCSYTLDQCQLTMETKEVRDMLSNTIQGSFIVHTSSDDPNQTILSYSVDNTIEQIEIPEFLKHQPLRDVLDYCRALGIKLISPILSLDTRQEILKLTEGTSDTHKFIGNYYESYFQNQPHLE